MEDADCLGQSNRYLDCSLLCCVRYFVRVIITLSMVERLMRQSTCSVDNEHVCQWAMLMSDEIFQGDVGDEIFRSVGRCGVE